MCGVRVCVGWDDGWLLSFGTGIAPDATCSMTCAIGVLSLAVPEDALQSASSERLTRVTTSGDVGVVCVLGCGMWLRERTPRPSKATAVGFGPWRFPRYYAAAWLL